MPRLSDDQRAALAEAELVLRNAYNPYSRFSVGACLVMRDGELVAGANVENSAYGSTLCAERAAILRANAEGMRVMRGIAIVGRPLGRPRKPQPEIVTGPCGSCRQMLFELAEIGDNDPWVVLATPSKQEIVVTSVRRLLPYGFGPRNLGRSDVDRWQA